jgi:polysaccharide biosynthesis/export protein
MWGIRVLSRITIFVLLLSFASVEQARTQSSGSQTARASTANGAGNTEAGSSSAIGSGNANAAKAASGAAAEDPANKKVNSSPPAPAPFIEDFPESDETDIPKPRPAMPVIVNSDSASLDREINRNDVPKVPDDYVIGEEDVLTITIWKEHDLSGTIVVRPDGKITVPLVGEVHVVGMKPIQLQTMLEDKLKPFITVPQVSVIVNQINSRKIYLIGQVVREGTFPINSSMTVLQVLSAAGGLRDFAKKKKIYILRKQGNEEIRFPFDYDAAIHGRNRDQNIEVEPGDTIVVP